MNAAKLTKKYMMLIVLILLIVFFSIFGENFLSVENAITVCRQVSIIGICATGMMFALLTAHIDLSIGATVSFAAVFWAKLISTNEGIMMNPYLAMLVVLFFCVIIGTANGLLVVKTNMPALIATMATSTVLEGVNYLITDVGNSLALEIRIFLTQSRSPRSTSPSTGSARATSARSRCLLSSSA